MSWFSYYPFLVSKSFLLLSTMPALISISFFFQFHNVFIKEYISLIHFRQIVLWFTCKSVKPITYISTFCYWQRMIEAIEQLQLLTDQQWVKQPKLSAMDSFMWCNQLNWITAPKDNTKSSLVPLFICLRSLQNHFHSKLTTGVDSFSSYAAWK